MRNNYAVARNCLELLGGAGSFGVKMNLLAAIPSSRAPEYLARRLNKFMRAEDGSMIIFSLFIFVMMLVATGLAVDLMRYETNRTQLQGTLDRAVLAAADLEQPLPAKDVILDYFEKAGMGDLISADDITVDEGLNYRLVSADTEVDVPMLFGGLLNVFRGGSAEAYEPVTPVLSAPAASTAEERIRDVEISLVLDISSSMLSNNRFENLKPAARDFVSTTLGKNVDANGGLVSVSMIPYSAVVNPGPAIANQINLQNTHNYSACPIFEDADFSSAAFDLTRTYERLGHFDYGASYAATPIAQPWCFAGTQNQIVAHSTDIRELHIAIDALSPFGNTAIDLGAKWAAALLDPGMRGVVGNIVGPADLAFGRPLDGGSADVQKVIVLMTDGQNTTEYDLDDDYRGAINFKEDLSFIWINYADATQRIADAALSQFSVQVRGLDTPTDRSDDKFYWLDQGSYDSANPPVHDHPQGYDSYQTEAFGARVPGRSVLYSTTVAHLSWQDIFANWVYSRVNNTLLREPYRNGWLSSGYYSASDRAVTAIVGGSAADERLDAICDAAKDQNTVIYTVAFEAPSHGEATLASCASSPSHFFRASGTDISAVFNSIAGDIAQLKLTQ